MYDVPIGPLEWDYTCKFGDGQVKAHLRQLTTEEEDSCFEATEDGAKLNKSRYVRLGCVSLSGLTAGGKLVTTGDEICETPGLYVLLAELFVAIFKGSDLSEEERKNSSGASV
jgi:hypothetical protein